MPRRADRVLTTRSTRDSAREAAAGGAREARINDQGPRVTSVRPGDIPAQRPGTDPNGEPDTDRVVAVVGGGYVGLTLAAHLVTTGRSVLVVEADPQRRQALSRGEIPIHETGVDLVIRQAVQDATLEVTGDIARTLDTVRMVFVTVGTPQGDDGHPDLSAVFSVVGDLRRHAKPGTVVAVKSTVPPGTARLIQERFEGAPFRLPVVSCPEFLREGSALRDMELAARHVIGGDDSEAMARVEAVIGGPGIPVITTDWTSAELIKYGSNAFLAIKISFANELARFADRVGADVVPVVTGMGLDRRIGSGSMRAGLGFGGCCLPKDVRALIATAERHGGEFGILNAALRVNSSQRALFSEKIRQAAGGQLSGRRIAVLGLAFKPGTDDMRDAPSLDIIADLRRQGAEVIAHDPCAIDKASPLLPLDVRLTHDIHECVTGADATAIVTEWPEYLHLDWSQARRLMRHPVLVDGRNCLDPGGLTRLGFRYHGIGRPAPLSGHRPRAGTGTRTQPS